MRELLEAGVHFGHQTRRWNPKMKKYVFIKRAGIHIIDLRQTIEAVNQAFLFLREVAAKGEYILFVGTKKQASEGIERAAKKADVFYITHRWYGGMLTNMKTIRRSIVKLEEYEKMLEDGTIEKFTKLERLKKEREYNKINNALGGVREMDRLPGALYIADTVSEEIAVHEANLLGIPIVALVDTNSNPDVIDYPIPANDDAIKAQNLLADIMAQAIIEGKQARLEGKDITELQQSEPLLAKLKREQEEKEKAEELSKEMELEKSDINEETFEQEKKVEQPSKIVKTRVQEKGKDR